jgi:arabinogalactan endo-1,4-beta-galactosidase
MAEMILSILIVPVPKQYVSSVDISSWPMIKNHNPVFYNLQGEQEEFLNILQSNGVNTIRLRLWVDPATEHSGFDDVKAFSNQLKAMGLKTWITMHYSDTWADPGKQEIPDAWKDLDFESLKDRVYTYTRKVMLEIAPDYIQIGNEINSGMLLPAGDISNNQDQFLELLNAGVEAVRINDASAEIILHFAGTEGSDWFYGLVSDIDYDIIGISFYPKWHGKSLANLRNQLIALGTTFNKRLLIAETAYPFTLDWNDWTNNIVGLESQLILPQYPATPDGQQRFIREIRNIISGIDEGLGFSYWGAELIAWDGPESRNGSPWENQALFDFQNRALPVLQEFTFETSN